MTTHPPTHPTGGSDDELTSFPSEDLHQSDRPHHLNLEPSTQLPHAAAEAAPPSLKCEEEEEEDGGARPVQSPSSCGED